MIDKYGARRIGHGYRVVDDDALMTECRDRGIHFEVCPTSSDETGGWMYDTRNWEDHPCLVMRRKDLSFSISSDDPAVFHTSLAWQYRLALVKMGMTREDIVQTNLNAVSAAFIDEDKKARLRHAIEKYSLSSGVDDETSENDVRHWHRSMSESFVDRTFADRVFVKQENGLDTLYL